MPRDGRAIIFTDILRWLAEQNA